MDVTIYHNPRCSKSRQTKELLEKKKVDFKVVEYLKDIPSQKELKDIIKKLGIKAQDLIRTKEADFTPYKGKSLSDTEWIKIMVKHPKLIERPIVVKGNKAAIGRPPESVLDIL